MKRDADTAPFNVVTRPTALGNLRNNRSFHGLADSAARVRMEWISRSEGHGAVRASGAQAGNTHSVHNIEDSELSERSASFSRRPHAPELRDVVKSLSPFFCARLSLSLTHTRGSCRGRRLFIKYVWHTGYVGGWRKARGDHPQNIAHFLSRNMGNDEGGK